jgi:pimeloyl-ACP methyl ester carboxylesterase
MMFRFPSARVALALIASTLLGAPATASSQSTAPRQPSSSPATTRLAHRFAERHVTSADGTRIAYLVAGAGRPLIMVHGSMTVADEWLAVADRLAATRRVIVVERRGRGRSGDAPVHSVAIEAQDLAAVVADVARSNTKADTSAGPVDLLGHSYGGAVVGRYASDAGFRGAVVLYDPGAGLNGPIADSRLVGVRALLDAGQRDSALASALSVVMGLPAPAIAGMRQNTALWTQFRTLLPSWIREIESLTNFAPSAEELGRIRGRTTILMGEKSGPMLAGIAGTWVGRQPGITVLPLRGLGHTGYMDAPAYTAERINAALRQ